MSASVASAPRVEPLADDEEEVRRVMCEDGVAEEGGKKWSAAAAKAEEKKKEAEEVDTDEDSDQWSKESDNEDPDGELGRIEWIERTKKDIASAVPHESIPFWNCVICGNQVSGAAATVSCLTLLCQCIGTSFIRFPERRDLGSPAANVHVFDCAIAFRKQYDYCHDWETKVGAPKAGFDIDGHKIEETPLAPIEESKDEAKAEEPK
jgi:hypothetical protein